MKNMKKVLFSVLIIALFAGVAMAYPETTGDISDVPQPGLWKSHLSSNQKLGAKCQIGSNTYQYVYNNAGTTEYQGHPAFWDWDAAAGGNGYYVTDANGMVSTYEAFAGIWLCDAWGGNSVGSGLYGWIVTGGVCEAYLCAPSGGTSIATGEVLVGTGTTEGNTQGEDYLIYLRGVVTGALTQATSEAIAVSWPRSLDPMTSSTPALRTIMVRP